MNMKTHLLSVIILFTCSFANAQKAKSYQLTSPDKKIVVKVQAGNNVSWSVMNENTSVLTPSTISLTLAGGEVLGRNAVVSSAKTSTVNTTIPSPVYKKSSVIDNYNQLALSLKGNYGIIFRAYNDGVAYRFVTNRKGDLTIQGEEANFNFDKDYKTYIPHVRDFRVPGDQFITSFEALYEEKKLSAVDKDTLGFLPVLIELANAKKVAIVESDLMDYPGLYVLPNASQGLKGVFAPYPLEEKPGGWNNVNQVVSKRADFIAKAPGNNSFPWRAIIVSSSDKELANNDMVYKLASPTRITDASWVKPGKVAWDWWNDWNITGVDFKAGINNPTYKYYIDFAAANNIEYVVLDEGWSLREDMTKISPNINLEELLAYGKQKGVGLILWATWYAINQRADEVFTQYSKMGVKGFKIDFLDRDDQKMVKSTYDIAKKAADYKLLIDYHGMFKPAGLQRTYPNVINFEGVKGLENVKWTPDDDVPRYDVSIPFIRMIAGPMDYTPGAMRNATKSGFRYSHSSPMSQGTRTHQLAMYVIFEAPLQMLADNPTAYMKEQESTNFIAKVPTTFDETVALDGKVAEYVAIARRKGDTWFVGAMTNWNQRDLTLDFSFLGEGTYEAEIFRDGVNADRDATDYKREVIKVTKNDKLPVKLAQGGGWAARIYKAK